MSKPSILTAIPKHHYKLGNFTLKVLGEIESRDPVQYRYIMAVIHGQDPEPGLYITAERASGSAGRSYDMRVMMPDGDEIIGSDSAWSDLEEFSQRAIEVVTRLLDLSDETPWQLL